MNTTTEIVICMGSSCFSRGNRQVLQQLKEYISAHHLEDKILFRGNHCFGNCVNGPVLKIDGTTYFDVDAPKAIALLNKHLQK